MFFAVVDGCESFLETYTGKETLVYQISFSEAYLSRTNKAIQQDGEAEPHFQTPRILHLRHVVRRRVIMVQQGVMVPPPLRSSSANMLFRGCKTAWHNAG
jgi:hypothetical protein